MIVLAVVVLVVVVLVVRSRRTRRETLAGLAAARPTFQVGPPVRSMLRREDHRL